MCTKKVKPIRKQLYLRSSSTRETKAAQTINMYFQSLVLKRNFLKIQSNFRKLQQLNALSNIGERDLKVWCLHTGDIFLFYT